jgi:hypothetical protein
VLPTFDPSVFFKRHGRVLKQLNGSFDAVPVIVMGLPYHGRVLFLPHVPACRVSAHHKAMDMRVVNQFSRECHRASSLPRRCGEVSTSKNYSLVGCDRH